MRNRFVLCLKAIEEVYHTIKGIIIEGIRSIIEVKRLLFFRSFKVLNNIMKRENIPKSVDDSLGSLVLDFEPLELYCE